MTDAQNEEKINTEEKNSSKAEEVEETKDAPEEFKGG